MNDRELVEKIAALEHARLPFTPHKVVKKYVQGVEDIYEQRQLLKSAALPEKSLSYIFDLFVQAIEEDQSFRRVATVRILKQLLKNSEQDGKWSAAFVDKLYAIFKGFILTGSEEMQETVSSFVLQQPLHDGAIDWLIAHWQESAYIAPVLLQYPHRHSAISAWALDTATHGLLPAHLSELAAIIIEDQLPTAFEMDSTTAIWAIYHSKVKKSLKRDLILQHLDADNEQAALEVAQQLGIPDVSRRLLKYYRGLLEVAVAQEVALEE